ncbi:MAG TPA: FAD-dependent oxidoreductase [Candidatus Methylomirabilis sp.]|nr:FAD-dependent oxidoreductase [Candidatus Methylomirabilis sp.]
MKDVGRILIIGAGPTGIGAAYRLKELRYSNFLLVEASDHPGGLASSFVDDRGFTWDVGGHVLFSHYDYFDNAMRVALGEDGWLRHERESWVWIANRFVPYPFQNNLRFLPADLIARAVRGLAARPPRTPAATQDFATWILQTFGEGIRDLFMAPYNVKVWAFPLERLSAGWVGERVAVVDTARVLESILLEKDDLSWGPNRTFQFPKRGGTGAIWRALAKHIGDEHVRYGTRIRAIDHEKNVATTDGGEPLVYDRILSTMPLDVLATTLEPRLEPVMDAAPKLLHSHTHVVGIGLSGELPASLERKCWMYFPEDNCCFHRVTVFSHYSPHNVPPAATGECWSLLAETSGSDVKIVDRATIVPQTIQGLLNTGLLRHRDQVVSTWHYTADHGYPIPTLERDDLLMRIEPALARAGIASRGRFGAWRYEVSNQDHSFMQGVEWVNAVLLDVPETTYRFPETANAMWGKSAGR